MIYLYIYLIVINIVAYILYYIDKRKAKKGKWRISEFTLIMFAVIGGGIGSIIAMYQFIHKTKKIKFRILVPIITVITIFTVILIIKEIIIP